MLKIGEFSILTSISIYMLRNYDKLGLLQPEFTDADSGYRYYTEEQIPVANRICVLKAMGFGLKDIATLIRPEVTAAQLEKRYVSMLKQKEKELCELQKQIRAIHTAIDDAGAETEVFSGIAVKTLCARGALCCRGTIKRFCDEGALWTRLAGICRENNVKLSQPAFTAAVRHGINENGDIDVEVMKGVEGEYKDIPGAAFKLLPERLVAVAAFTGDYDNIYAVNSHMASWLRENLYEVTGPVFSLYHISPGNSDDKSRFVTELCFPVKEK